MLLGRPYALPVAPYSRECLPKSLSCLTAFRQRIETVLVMAMLSYASRTSEGLPQRPTERPIESLMQLA